MAEEEKKVESGNNESMDATTYIEALNKIKSSTVDKSLYEESLKENRQLMNALANGSTLQPAEAVQGPTKADLEKAILHGSTNLEIVQASLAHRQKVLEETGMDEYAYGTSNIKTYNPTQEQIANAEATAAGLAELVEAAEGDPDVFDTLLQKNSRK